MKGLKQEDALSPPLNFYLECANRNVQAIQEGLKMNGTYQLLVYAGNVNLLCKNIHNIQKNTDVLLVISSKIER
jgi:hypothetical protein